MLIISVRVKKKSAKLTRTIFGQFFKGQKDTTIKNSKWQKLRACATFNWL